ncbi:unnamed protein product [Allacma fusca]|uniref:Uncharacterized protein n=1 Tax=Allacma fusca TaxID=39272 RepID=A0A8J2L135_9HEXA|nr:unnamed protein product [Allacma fusca]
MTPKGYEDGRVRSEEFFLLIVNYAVSYTCPDRRGARWKSLNRARRLFLDRKGSAIVTLCIKMEARRGISTSGSFGCALIFGLIVIIGSISGHSGHSGPMYRLNLEDDVFLPDQEPTTTKRDVRAEYGNKTGNGCWFGPEYQSLFNSTEVVQCSADLSGGIQYLSRILFDPPKNPSKFYRHMNRTYCPLWIQGVPCLRKVLRVNCNDIQLYKMKMDNLINFLIPINEVFCSDSFGSRSLFEFIKLGGSECMGIDETFQKPMDKCLKKNKFSDSPTVAKYFSTYQKCAAPLLGKCDNVGDASRLVPLMRKFFEDMYIQGKQFWRDIDA